MELLQLTGTVVREVVIQSGFVLSKSARTKYPYPYNLYGKANTGKDIKTSSFIVRFAIRQAANIQVEKRIDRQVGSSINCFPHGS